MRTTILFSLACCLVSVLQAQTICYAYDTAGNRVTKFSGPCKSFIVSPGEQSTVADSEQLDLEQGKTAMPTVTFSQSPATARIYPNPNNGHFELRLDEAPESNAWFEVYDVKGILVLRQQADGYSTVFDLSSSVGGDYFLFLYNQTGVVGKWKVVKQ